MAVLERLTEGWTAELAAFTCKLDDVAQSLDGITIELVLRDNQDRRVTVTGTTRKDVDQTGGGKGKVYYKPGASDLKKRLSPYRIRWKATDGAGDVVYYPDGEPDTIEVFEP